MKDKILRAKQVAEYLQLNEVNIYKMAKRGEIPAFMIACEWRFMLSDITKWIENLKIKTNAGKTKELAVR